MTPPRTFKVKGECSMCGIKLELHADIDCPAYAVNILKKVTACNSCADTRQKQRKHWESPYS